jgi:hypothetical protein
MTDDATWPASETITPERAAFIRGGGTPMTDDELAAIRARDKYEGARVIHTPEWKAAQTDRRALLDEVVRLRAQLTDAWDEGFHTGWKHGTRLASATVGRAVSEPTNPYRTLTGDRT